MLPNTFVAEDWLKIAGLKRDCTMRDSMKAVRKVNSEAVSPVIATILLLAITVLLTGAVYMTISNSVSAPDKGVPTGKGSVRMLDNGYQVVTISEMNAQVETFKCKFQIIPPEGSNSSSITGYASDGDVYGVSGQDVSFQDRDAGFTVNSGDYFVIDAASVGSDEGDWRFRLLFEGTGGRSNGEIFAVTLPGSS